MKSIKVAFPLAFLMMLTAAGCSDRREQEKFREKVRRLQLAEKPMSSHGLNRRMK